MLTPAVCSPLKNKSDSIFTFDGFEESDLPDSLIEEGPIERNEVKTSFADNQMNNSPLSSKNRSMEIKFEARG